MSNFPGRQHVAIGRSGTGFVFAEFRILLRPVDAIYFSSGGKGSQAILSAVDARSGKIH